MQEEECQQEEEEGREEGGPCCEEERKRSESMSSGALSVWRELRAALKGYFNAFRVTPFRIPHDNERTTGADGDEKAVFWAIQ